MAGRLVIVTNDEQSADVRGYLRKIARMSRLIGSQRVISDGLDEYMGYQESLAALQREIQQSVRDCKRRAGRDAKAHERLAEMRQVRWHSRRLGDALAWSMLLHDRRTILPLTQNARVPISTSADDDGTVGLFKMARLLVSREWGVPIIHDVTDCLRIGDITFLNFGASPNERFFKTYEVKTTRVSSTPNEDGSEEVTLNIQLVSTEPIPGAPEHLLAQPAPSDDHGPVQPARPRREDRRLQKQLDRMHEARERRDAPDNAISQVAGKGFISLALDDDGPSQWKMLRQSIRKAKCEGYAFFSIDGFTGYGVFYDSVKITAASFTVDAFAKDINGLLMHTNKEKASLLLRLLPIGDDDQSAPKVLPFFLYDIPQTAKDDLLYGRLSIMSVTNYRRLEEEILSRGFETAVPEGSSTFGEFNVHATLRWPDGRSLRVRSPMPWEDIVASIHEFRGMKSVIDKLEAVRNMPQNIAFEDFNFEMHGEAGASAYHEAEHP